MWHKSNGYYEPSLNYGAIATQEPTIHQTTLESERFPTPTPVFAPKTMNSSAAFPRVDINRFTSTEPPRIESLRPIKVPQASKKAKQPPSMPTMQPIKIEASKVPNHEALMYAEREAPVRKAPVRKAPVRKAPNVRHDKAAPKSPEPTSMQFTKGKPTAQRGPKAKRNIKQQELSGTSEWQAPPGTMRALANLPTRTQQPRLKKSSAMLKVDEIMEAMMMNSNKSASSATASSASASAPSAGSTASVIIVRPMPILQQH